MPSSLSLILAASQKRIGWRKSSIPSKPTLRSLYLLGSMIRLVVSGEKPYRLKSLWYWAHPHKINPSTYLPPGGSIAFKKELWAAVGGYPEWLTSTGEDTTFDLELKLQGGNWAILPGGGRRMAGT